MHLSVSSIVKLRMLYVFISQKWSRRYCRTMENNSTSHREVSWNFLAGKWSSVSIGVPFGGKGHVFFRGVYFFVWKLAWFTIFFYSWFMKISLTKPSLVGIELIRDDLATRDGSEPNQSDCLSNFWASCFELFVVFHLCKTVIGGSVVIASIFGVEGLESSRKNT